MTVTDLRTSLHARHVCEIFSSHEEDLYEGGGVSEVLPVASTSSTCPFNPSAVLSISNEAIVK